MVFKNRKVLLFIGVAVALYLICFAMYTRNGVTLHSSLRYIKEHAIGNLDRNSSFSSPSPSPSHSPPKNPTGGGSELSSSPTGPQLLPNSPRGPQLLPKSPTGPQLLSHDPTGPQLHKDPTGTPTVEQNATVRVVPSSSQRSSLPSVESNPDHGPNFPCLDRFASKFGRVEDMFCTTIGKYETRFKNPCFYDYEAYEVKRLRCLPYFYIIGPDKCGTTDLHSRLMNHPQLMENDGVIKKEVSFWGWRRVGKMNSGGWLRNETSDGYMKYFDKTARLLESGGNETWNVVTGDASPMDFYDFHGWSYTPQNWGKSEPAVVSPLLIRALHGSKIPKMIAHFRDPIERIFSLYVFLGGGNNPDKFHRDVIDSMEKLRKCIEQKGQRYCFFDGPLFKSMHVKLHTSCYSVFMKEWLGAFPRKHFFISRLEDTSANMKQTLKDIYSFLEVEPLPEETLDRISQKAKKHVTAAKVGVTMLPETAELLREFYRPCNEELAKMLNDDRYLWMDTPHQ